MRDKWEKERMRKKAGKNRVKKAGTGGKIGARNEVRAKKKNKTFSLN